MTEQTATWQPRGLSHIDAGDYEITVKAKGLINSQELVALRDAIIANQARESALREDAERSGVQLVKTLALLCDIDAVMDFGVPFGDGPDGGANFEDSTEVNRVWEQCREWLAFMPDDIRQRVSEFRLAHASLTGERATPNAPRPYN